MVNGSTASHERMQNMVTKVNSPTDPPREFESRASIRSDRGPRYGGGQQKSPWAGQGGMRSGVESGSHQGVEQQKTSGEISKREHSKLQAKNVLGADASKKQLRQKARDIRKTGRATDKRTKSDAKLLAKQKASDAKFMKANPRTDINADPNLDEIPAYGPLSSKNKTILRDAQYNPQWRAGIHGASKGGVKGDASGISSRQRQGNVSRSAAISDKNVANTLSNIHYFSQGGKKKQMEYFGVEGFGKEVRKDKGWNTKDKGKNLSGRGSAGWDYSNKITNPYKK
ncbi:MAG: hypothetical protein GY777_23110 [Candidatus Brocadiaceae bacterium]|nr:hypothetical protein [Candidatus Brocadiaceae bacterium]